MAKGGGRTDGWMDGRLEIPPCVLQDIGPLGPLPKKQSPMSFKYFNGTGSFGYDKEIVLMVLSCVLSVSCIIIF